MLMQILVAIVCAALLIALISAFIFSDKFRKDVLVGEGEARIFGIITVKGIAIIVLSGLFLGGLIYSTHDPDVIPKKDFTKDIAPKTNDKPHDQVKIEKKPGIYLREKAGKGVIISQDMIEVVPGSINDLPSMADVLNACLQKDVSPDKPIKWEDIGNTCP